MNLKRDMLAFAVRFLAENTRLVRKPDAFEELLNTMFGGETFDQRMARDLEPEVDKVLETVKKTAARRRARKDGVYYI